MNSMNVKLAAVAVLTAMSATAFGKTFFKKDSAVPLDLQTHIEQKFEEKCRLTKNYRVQLLEESTYIQADRFDHGRENYVYTTTFNAYRVLNSYNAGYIGQVVIESAQYNDGRSENVEVLSITPPQTVHCL